ncbi:isochorismatase family protein [Actinoplanes sp. NPDC051411]|uniref:cysteine hydrolase family protein n=1 Tax=Actinoplanes sp. NPDC051411 TaxID=3155522 RepID=UPI00342E3096
MRIRDGVRKLLSEAEVDRLERAGFGLEAGVGERPAMVVIDAQRYMVAPDAGSDAEFPSSCGDAGRAALTRLAELLDDLRAARVPVFYTRFELARDGSDIGAYGRKRSLLDTENWCLEGSSGAEIHPAVAPSPGDHVFVKKKPSAFFGTPLTALLIQLGIDTVLLAGGSTANCVRATAIDAMSLNFRTVVVEDCVFDRLAISHEVALFDLERQAADVVPSHDLRRALALK